MTKEETSGEFLGAIFLILLIVPHGIIWFILFYKLFSKNIWVALVSIGFSILALPYFGDGFVADVQGIGSSFESVLNGDQNIFMFFLSMPLQYGLGSQILIALVCFTAVAFLKLFADEDLPIKSLHDVVKPKEEKEMDFRFNVAQNRPGETIIGFRMGKRLVTLQDKAKHIFVCGTTGAGKTVMLANFIESAINKNYPLFLIDGKGDTGKGSMLDIINKFKGNRKLYVINMLDPLNCDKYNPFKSANPTVAADMLINLTEWSEEHYKVHTQRYLQQLLRLLVIGEIELSFDTILDHLGTRKANNLLNSLLKDKKIAKTEYEQIKDLFEMSTDIAKNAAARFLTLYESEVGGMFCSGGVDIFTALKENAIILFILNPLLYPETAKSFGKLLLVDSKIAVSNFYEVYKDRVFYILDEINTYASYNLIDLLNKSRSANVTCILATQSLSDLEDAGGVPFRETVIENCNNYILMRQNSGENAEAWAKIIGTKEGLDVTYQIGEEDNRTVATGRGTVKKGRQFIFHPDDIKDLATGEAFFVSRDTKEKYKIQARIGF